MTENQVSAGNASEALVNVIDVITYQRRVERQNIFISVISIAAVMMGVFMFEIMPLEAVIFLYMSTIL